MGDGGNHYIEVLGPSACQPVRPFTPFLTLAWEKARAGREEVSATRAISTGRAGGDSTLRYSLGGDSGRETRNILRDLDLHIIVVM